MKKFSRLGILIPEHGGRGRNMDTKKPFPPKESSRRKTQNRINLAIITSAILQAIFLYLLLLFPVPVFSTNKTAALAPGFKYYKNYSYRDYDHHPQNYCIAQDKKGLIYVGNAGGVLIFDGVNWTLVEVPNMTVRSMAVAGDGRVYIGGLNEIGVLAPDSRGFPEYTSLTKHLNPIYGQIPEVWNTVATQEGVYFRTSRLLFRWNYHKIDFYKEGKFGPLYFYNGKLFIQQAKVGLMMLKNDALTPLPGFESLGKKIRLMVPIQGDGNSETFVLGTSSDGLQIYRDGTLQPFTTEVDDFLKKSTVSHGIGLSNGDIAVATRSGGIAILNNRGGLKYSFNKAGRLQDNSVDFVFEDNRGNLWLALSKGVSRLENQSPFQHYDDRHGLEGMVLAVSTFKDNLYAGTIQGLYVLKENAGLFSPIEGVPSCRSLLQAGNTLLAGTFNGVYQVDTNESDNTILHTVHTEHTYKLIASRQHPGHAWCAGRSGLTALRLENSRWTTAHRHQEIDNDIRDMAESPTGDLWLVSGTGNLLKVDFPAGIAHPVLTRYDMEGGLYTAEIYPAVADGRVVFASRQGLFHYDRQGDRFLPDMMLGEKFAKGPGATPVFRIIQDKNKDIWFHSKSRNYHASPRPGQPPLVEFGPFRRVPTTQVNDIYPDPNEKAVWYAGTEGVLRYDTSNRLNWKKEFPALIRTVFINDTNPISGGGNSGNNPAEPPVLPYKDRHISFQCAAPFFQDETRNMFRYKLDGFSDQWSEWTRESRKYYTNLDAGAYTFRVQAKNIYDVISREDTFDFEVLPPWFMTWWAFVLYAAGAFLLLNGFVKWRSHKLVREKMKLEETVHRRTRKIKKKNALLEQQATQLQEQSEKLKEMDKAKSSFFANISHEFRTPLTLIMSPVEQLLSREKDTGKNIIYQTILRNAQQLLTFINQLLELSRLDSGKMKLKTAYMDMVALIKDTITSFHTLAEQQELTLEFQCPLPEVYLYIDVDKMEEVLYNLLSNAVKFTPPGGKITVSAEVETASKAVVISVKDTGCGIPGEQLANIFDRFFRAGEATGNSIKGTGIGLSLSREFIRLHGGTIDVHSREDSGTEFVVRLPLEEEHPGPTGDTTPLALGSAPRRDRTKEIEIMAAAAKDGKEPVPPESDTGDTGETEDKVPDKEIILVVEDHRDMRKHIRDILEPSYRVIEAVNGKEGMDIAGKHMPALVVSDIMMPEFNGYDLCTTLKKDIKTCHIPVILLTAKASEKSIAKGLGAGADDYVTKPFNAGMLLTRIRNLIELRRQMQLKIKREKMLLPSKVTVSNQDEQFLEEFQKVIEENLDNPDFNIEVLGKKLFIGRSTLFKKIHALTGETPNQFIQSYRLERGAQLLRENYGNVTEVAMAVGFSSSQYFARCFKERFHQSPKAFQAAESKTP